ncbi:MAG: MBOAT family protein [Tenericutes bacterium]|nr:MBOAT family protein [Mycoplasmatota bacterium]
MLFSSISFLYYFLPLVLISFFVAPKKYKNIILLIFSLFFYFYGEGKLTIVLILSCTINYFIAILIDRNNKESKRKFWLVIGLIVNLSLLIYFKYFNFFLENINHLLNVNIAYLNVVMPLGISFFTFQALSYLVDVYRKEVKADLNIINLTTYITLFPQLVAGPIVRYQTIKKELINKDISYENISYGINRFIIGLSKKVLLANNLGLLVSLLKETPDSTLSMWLISISFTLQIYFDFSGYSDMAIGLGRIFGFKFLENFNYPYISKSITDFWKRWHISLSSFLKDYVYIPLGGNRCSKSRWIFNIVTVWFLTGFWHGAQWNFILWGLYFAIILLVEKFFIKDFIENKKIINHIYVMFLVIISFTIFNGESLIEVFNNLKLMFSFNGNLYTLESIYYLKSFSIILIISVISSTPIIKNIINKINDKYNKSIIINIIFIVGIMILFIITTAYLIDSTFNPFLYFRF